MKGVEILALLPARIAGRIRVGAEDSCWSWLGCCNGFGYGQAKLNGRTISVPHLVLEAKLGRKLEKKEVTRHSCDNPSCCNPNHLDVGSYFDNARDMVSRGRAASVFGSSNGRAKFTEKEVRLVFELRSQGLKLHTIAVRVGCSLTNVNHILRGETWAHLGLRS